LIKVHGENRFVMNLAQALECNISEIRDSYQQLKSELCFSQIRLRGADIIALILAQQKVTHAFAYPGTSELALCDSIARSGHINLVNGRGDKECVLAAAGVSLWNPGQGIAVLHGARGSTNALGAIGSARRNEIGVVCIVGLPNTSSQR